MDDGVLLLANQAQRMPWQPFMRDGCDIGKNSVARLLSICLGLGIEACHVRREAIRESNRINRRPNGITSLREDAVSLWFIYCVLKRT